MHHQHFDEHSRVTKQIKIHGRDYLPESFNLDLYRYPSWKDDNKTKWLTPKGFDNKSGVDAAHVVKLPCPGSGKRDMHAHSLNNQSAWPLCHNEPVPGENPYSISYPEMTEIIMQRKRLQSKEISPVPFNATCR